MVATKGLPTAFALLVDPPRYLLVEYYSFTRIMNVLVLG